ncbi:unnamed protein product [Soboliphyme baturini]|uniref:Clathrin_bdg domain-containing protein n=1 Tax=Soboliphyme baturini TaxID=241478 RepID=A0A183IU96_9BILA|nr:unnamed protein product [Soboliphyme baturini]
MERYLLDRDLYLSGNFDEPEVTRCDEDEEASTDFVREFSMMNHRPKVNHSCSKNIGHILTYAIDDEVFMEDSEESDDASVISCIQSTDASVQMCLTDECSQPSHVGNDGGGEGSTAASGGNLSSWTSSVTSSQRYAWDPLFSADEDGFNSFSNVFTYGYDDADTALATLTPDCDQNWSSSEASQNSRDPSEWSLFMSKRSENHSQLFSEFDQIQGDLWKLKMDVNQLDFECNRYMTKRAEVDFAKLYRSVRLSDSDAQFSCSSDSLSLSNDGSSHSNAVLAIKHCSLSEPCLCGHSSDVYMRARNVSAPYSANRSSSLKLRRLKETKSLTYDPGLPIGPGLGVSVSDSYHTQISVDIAPSDSASDHASRKAMFNSNSFVESFISTDLHSSDSSDDSETLKQNDFQYPPLSTHGSESRISEEFSSSLSLESSDLEWEECADWTMPDTIDRSSELRVIRQLPALSVQCLNEVLRDFLFDVDRLSQVSVVPFCSYRVKIKGLLFVPVFQLFFVTSFL